MRMKPIVARLGGGGHSFKGPLRASVNGSFKSSFWLQREIFEGFVLEILETVSLDDYNSASSGIHRMIRFG